MKNAIISTVISTLPAIAVLAIAFLTAQYLSTRWKAIPEPARFASIEGLRGWLAVFVFICHASVWYGYLHEKVWKLPPQRLYVHFGEGGVALFFMITSFLFGTKLLEAKEKPIDWERLFVSRIFRLGPLYLAAMLVLWSIVAVLSHGTLQTSFESLVGACARWATFTVFGNPDINGVADTALINAYVCWSLVYEVLFYCLLPAMSLCLGRMPPLRWLIPSAAAAVYMYLWQPPIFFFLPFCCGFAAALLIRIEQVRRFAATTAATWIMLAVVVFVVALNAASYTPVVVCILGIPFTLIAAGNTCFGWFTHPASRVLGLGSFGIYLLHGMTLFVAFHFIVGTDTAAGWSPVLHWILVAAVTPVLIVLSHIAFRTIENPMKRAGRDRPSVNTVVAGGAAE